MNRLAKRWEHQHAVMEGNIANLDESMQKDAKWQLRKLRYKHDQYMQLARAELSRRQKWRCVFKHIVDFVNKTAGVEVRARRVHVY